MNSKCLFHVPSEFNSPPKTRKDLMCSANRINVYPEQNNVCATGLHRFIAVYKFTVHPDVQQMIGE